MFKKMHEQKRKEMIKDYEKQEKRIKEMKAHGTSKKQAVSDFIIYWNENEVYVLFVGEEAERSIDQETGEE